MPAHPAPTSVKTLRVLSGPQAGAHLVLDGARHLLGSSESACDLVLFGEGVAPVHCAIEFDGERHGTIEVFEGAEVQLDGDPLPPGTHGVELPLHLRLAGIDLLLGVQRESREDSGAGETPVAVRRRVSRRAARIASSLACVGLLLIALVNGALGWFEKPEPQEIARARKVINELGYGGLGVAHDVEGLLTVTGYVGTPEDAKRLRHALQALPDKPVAVNVVVGGAAMQFERQAAPGPQETRRLGAGSVLIESGQGTASAPAAPDATLALQVRALQAGDDGYIETVSGTRYFLGSQMPEGYTLKLVESDMVMVSREGVDTMIRLRR